MRHGQGVMHYASGSEYTGEWECNLKCGHGSMTWVESAESYVGEWKDDKPHGQGTFLWHTLLPGSQPLGASAAPGQMQVRDFSASSSQPCIARCV